jgi:hypothetical protein
MAGWRAGELGSVVIVRVLSVAVRPPPIYSNRDLTHGSPCRTTPTLQIRISWRNLLARETPAGVTDVPLA